MIEFILVDDREQIGELFWLTEHYGLLELTFYKGMTSDEFGEHMASSHLYAVAANKEIVGYTWLNQFTGLSAQVHVCLFPTASAKVKLKASKQFCSFIFKHSHLECLVGLIPETHSHAFKYAMWTGFNMLGVIPCGITVMNQAVDLYVLVIEQADLEED